MESPERPPEELSAEQASEDLDPERGPLENAGDPDGEPYDTDPSEMTGSAEPGTTATPEGDPVPGDLDEELEDRGDV
jgi:hypothetical protein